MSKTTSLFQRAHSQVPERFFDIADIAGRLVEMVRSML